MHYGLTDEQQQLRGTVAKLLENLAVRRERYDGIVAPDATTDRERAVWSALVESGIGMLGVPEELDGPGGTCIDQVVVAEELGAALARTPFVLDLPGRRGAGSADLRARLVGSAARRSPTGCGAARGRCGRAGRRHG